MPVQLESSVLKVVSSIGRVGLANLESRFSMDKPSHWAHLITMRFDAAYSVRLFRHLPIYGALTLALLYTAALSASGAEEAADSAASARAAAMLRGVHRIVFLGDSITQAGDYVVDCECWLLAHGFEVEVLNLGLASETATDLTPEENAAHLKSFGFGRPFVSERLDRVLAATKPDLLFACYGMNDGGSLPRVRRGTRRFAEAITKLREAATKAGVKRVVLCTPPVFDAKGDAKQKFHEDNLARYTAWLLSERTKGWDVVDIHTPMRRALDEGRAKNPAFKFADDGVHPGREGHWLMAREILTQFFGAKLEGVARAEDLFPGHGREIRKLVHERMVLLFDAWMTQIGHQRPGVTGGPDAKPGPPTTEANAEAAELAKRIHLQMDAK
jgi:lysophospholipase L1-like esterase